MGGVMGARHCGDLLEGGERWGGWSGTSLGTTTPWGHVVRSGTMAPPDAGEMGRFRYSRGGQ